MVNRLASNLVILNQAHMVAWLIGQPKFEDPWLEHNVQPAGTDVRSNPQQDCQQAKCYARADPVLHHRLVVGPTHARGGALDILMT